MKPSVPLLAAAMTAALLSASSFARPGWVGDPGRDDPLRFLDRVAEDIGLTVDQEAAINELIDEARLSSAVDRERLGQIREELHRLSRSDQGFDSDAASVLAEELAGIVARTAMSRSETHWRLRQILTPEQREQLDEWRGSRGQHRVHREPLEPLAE